MKQLALSFIFIFLFAITETCLADGQDLANMTTQQLNQLKTEINERLDADHEATSSERSRIESAVNTTLRLEQRKS